MFPPFALRNGNDEGSATPHQSPPSSCKTLKKSSMEVAHMEPYSSRHQHIHQLADVLHLLQILYQIDYLANVRPLQHTVGTIFELVL